MCISTYVSLQFIYVYKSKEFKKLQNITTAQNKQQKLFKEIRHS